MEPERKVIKSNASISLESNHQDIGVCGTYRHRVINKSPLLLTPDLAPKLYEQGVSESDTVNLSHSSSILEGSPGYLPKDLSSFDDIGFENTSEKSDINFETGLLATDSNSGQNDNKTYLSSSNEIKTTNVEMNLQNRKPVKDVITSSKSSDSLIKTTPRRERVIEILPSLILPVTSLPGKKDVVDMPRKDGSRRNASTISTSSSITSLSDLQSVKTLDEQDFSSDVESLPSVFDLQTKYDQLAQASKLADADMAILVSSKQQLQLEIHSKDEKLRILSRNYQEAIQNMQINEKMVEDLKESIQKNEEKHDSELLDAQRKHEDEIYTINNAMNVSNAERDSKKLELGHTNQNLEKYVMKCEKMENELKNLNTRNSSLEEILQKTNAEGQGSKIFVDRLKQDNLELSKQLSDTNQEYMMLKIKHKAIETKFVDLQQSHSDLSERAANHESRFRETDSNNAALSGHLRIATKEKQELNSAVQRLRLDLVKVESSFSRLKQQMIEKSRLAEQETTKRLELEEKLHPLLNEKVNNTSIATRIRDKNIQIEQLLSRSKNSTKEKLSFEKTIKELQSHIDKNEKSWKNAIEKEKDYFRSLKEKEAVLTSKCKEVEALSLNLSLEKQTVEDSSRLLHCSKEKISELERKLKNAESAISENKLSSATSDEENDEKVITQKDEEILQLKNEVGVLQTSLNAKEESLSEITQTSENQDEHSLRQLELLSELQSARRQLSEERDSLVEENKNLTEIQNNLKCRNDLLLSELNDRKEQAEKKISEMSTEALATEQKLRDEITALQQTCLELPAQTKVVEEERDILKQELSNLMLQFTDVSSYTKEIDNLVEERDLLKNAVMRQQEYSKSLQKHYENWANEAAKKMREEIMTARNSPNRQIIMENFYSNNNPNHQSIINKNGPSRKSLTEEQENFATEKLQLTQKIDELEKQISTQEKEILQTTIATQTEEQSASCHDLSQQYSRMSSINEFVETEDILNESNSELIALTEEKFQLMQENTHQAELISELETRLQNWSSFGKPLLEDSGTQTSHDEEFLPFPTKISQLLEDATTQTEHDNEVVGNNQSGTILQLQQQNYDLRLVIQELKKLGHDSANGQMLEDCGTQTNHDNDLVMPLVSILLEDSSTQTEHDAEVVGNVQQDTVVEALREELKISREDVDNLTKKLKEAALQKDNLPTIISNCDSNPDKDEIGTQTSHDDEPIHTNFGETNFLNAITTDAYTQTDHDFEVVRSKRPVPLISNSGDGDNGQEINNMTVCRSCNSKPPDRPPSPMTILKTMESKKLSAYKNTVHLLKRKLKSSENTISNLQAELKVLMPVNSGGIKNNNDDSIQQNGESTEGISHLQQEIYELKRTFALQGEETRRKHLAGKKMLESKVLKLNERITRLTETNEIMRNSVETLQVKLTEKKMVLDIVEKEKNRFKTRARRLQASLRSLAWITGKQEKTLLAEIDGGVVDFTIDENTEDSFGLENQSLLSSDSTGKEHQCKENRFSISLPTSVNDVEESLKDLQLEIMALEKQMQEHNNAVKKSKTQWGRLKEESSQELLPQGAAQRSEEKRLEVQEVRMTNTKIV